MRSTESSREVTIRIGTSETLANGFEHLNARHLGQIEVEEDHVERFGQSRFDRLGAVVNAGDREPLVLKVSWRDLDDLFLVVDDERSPLSDRRIHALAFAGPTRLPAGPRGCPSTRKRNSGPLGSEKG